MGIAGADVIINRKASRLVEHDGLRRVVLAAASAGGARVHETDGIDALERVARDIAARGSDAVVLAGGDGSYMAGLSALVRAHEKLERPLPPIGLAPGGTVGTVARNVGMTGSRTAWTKRIVKLACADAGTRAMSVRAQPTLRVRDDGGGDRVGFIFGAGLVVRFFDAYYAAPRQGRRTAAALVARIFAGSFTGGRLASEVLSPTACSLRADGVTHASPRWNLILASVIRDMGLHMLVPYRAGEDPDRFHLVASGLAPRALAAQLPRVLRGLPLTGEPRVDALVRSLRLAFEGADGGYVFDGDMFRARAVTIEPGPVVSLL